MPLEIASNGEVSYSATNFDSALTMLMAVYVYGEEAVKDTKQIALRNTTGAGRFGERDLLSQAREYLECTARYPVNFCTPQVHFAFYNQVTDSMAAALEGLGVHVWGERVPVESTVLDKLQGLGLDDSSQDSDGSCDDNPDDYDTNDHVGDRQVPGMGFLLPRLPEHFESAQSPMTVKDFTIQKSKIEHKATFCNKESVSSATDLNIDSRLLSDCVSTAVVGHRKVTCDKAKKQLFLELVISPPSYSSFISTSSLSKESGQNQSHPPPSFPVPESQAITTTPSVSALCLEGVGDIQRVNLDITSLIALVSSVTNGRCHLVFPDKVLTEQAREEREDPVLPALNRFLTG
ncbi:UPF0415 protein C7orf25-like protein [Elysia marginata]|uniref:UPF0415 protein C7orf25-like protein n=1 Tax=Elysia marginata TaxID=1093978 RepID=A0AAV4EIQ4_9GAST|nr:UPF0415 protein C7orf25-like protein [Elysia marginata]